MVSGEGVFPVLFCFLVLCSDCNFPVKAKIGGNFSHFIIFTLPAVKIYCPEGGNQKSEIGNQKIVLTLS